jgi:translation initiation factor IF-2
MAVEEQVKLVTSKVIYSLLDDARQEFANYMPAEPIQIVHGRGKVQALFDIGGIDDKVAGLKVVDGVLFKDKATTKDGVKLKSEYRILRDGKAVNGSTYAASSLKYFKDDVSEVTRGKECGLSLAGCNDFQEGDEVECFSVEMRREFA